MHNDGLLKEVETMTEKSAFDKTLGELHDPNGRTQKRPSENSTPGSRKRSGFTLTARFCPVSCKPWSW